MVSFNGVSHRLMEYPCHGSFNGVSHRLMENPCHGEFFQVLFLFRCYFFRDAVSFQMLFLFTSSSLHHPLEETERLPSPELEETPGRLQVCSMDQNARKGRTTGRVGGQTKRNKSKTPRLTVQCFFQGVKHSAAAATPSPTQLSSLPALN